MLKLIAFLCLAAVVSAGTTTTTHVFPVSLRAIEGCERSLISKFRNWHPYVSYNTDLMKIAQSEAERLSTLGNLLFMNTLSLSYEK